MNLYQGILRCFALLYILGGVLWYGAIQFRCETIAPRAALAQATSVVSSAASTTVSKSVVMVRSPHAKDYHLFLFRGITYAEVFVAVFYVTAGLFLLKPFVLSRYFVLTTIWLDVIFKLSLIAYMKLCAEPLARLTHNANVLQLYFLPNDKASSILTSYANGYRFFAAEHTTYMILCGGFLLLSLAFFKLPQVRDLLKP